MNYTDNARIGLTFYYALPPNLRHNVSKFLNHSELDLTEVEIYGAFGYNYKYRTNNTRKEMTKDLVPYIVGLRREKK